MKLFALAACLAVTACTTTPSTVILRHTVSLTTTQAVSTTVELVQAHNAGGAAEVRRVLVERWGAQAKEGPGFVRLGVDAPRLLLVLRLADVPACRSASAGVVVDEPARVVGCGVQELSALAAFVLAAESLPQVALVLADDDEAVQGAGVVAPLSWSAGGVMLQSIDADVFNLEVVDTGAVEVQLSRIDADTTALVAAAGRVASWRSPPMVPRVVRDRLALLPRPWWVPLDADANALARDVETADLVVERCRVTDVSSTAVTASCAVLPGRQPDDVVEAVVAAVNDPSTALRVVAQRAPTASGFEHPAALALRARLAADAPRAVMVPSVRTRMPASACDGLRRRGMACVGGVPLLLHPVERGRVGTEDEAVAVDALTSMVVRVVDAVDTVVGAP